MNKELKEKIAVNAANEWCRCFKCDGRVNATGYACEKDKRLTCHKWYDGYRTALLALEEAENTSKVTSKVREDLELTWEDMRELHIIFTEVDTEIELCKTDIIAETLGYYQEVLRRFKERKVRL